MIALVECDSIGIMCALLRNTLKPENLETNIISIFLVLLAAIKIRTANNKDCFREFLLIA